MHGLIVLGFNGAVVFHTSPLTRAVVDHIAEVVQSDLHMSVATQYYANVVAARGANLGGGMGAGEGGSGASNSGAFSDGHHQYSSTGVLSGSGGSASTSRRFDGFNGANRATMAPNAVSSSASVHLGAGGGGASNLSRSQTNAMYRASVAIERAGDAAASAAAAGHSSSSATTRGRSGSAFAPKEIDNLSSQTASKKRRFKFMAKFDSNGNSVVNPVAGGNNGGGSSSSSSAATSYFVSDTAFATSNCMARNVKAICDGIIAISPSEHAWLRHHITCFVAIGEPRREEADEDLITADPEAVARVGVPSAAATSGNGGAADIISGISPARGAAFGGGGVGGVGGGGSGNGPASTTASTAAVFTRGVNVVPAPPTQMGGTTNPNGTTNHLLSNSNNNNAAGDNHNNGGAATKYVNPTTTGGGGIVLDPTVATAELFVMLYWRKVGDRVFIMVLHEDDSVALAKHILSTFIVLLSETFRLHVTDGAEVSAIAGGGGGGTSSAVTSSHMGMQYQRAGGGAAGSASSAHSGAGGGGNEPPRLFAAMERVMREDAALSQLPTLRAMMMRPDMVQRCLDVVAPQNIMAMVDLPMARVCIQRQLKGK